MMTLDDEPTMAQPMSKMELDREREQEQVEEVQDQPNHQPNSRSQANNIEKNAMNDQPDAQFEANSSVNGLSEEQINQTSSNQEQDEEVLLVNFEQNDKKAIVNDKHDSEDGLDRQGSSQDQPIVEETAKPELVNHETDSKLAAESSSEPEVKVQSESESYQMEPYSNNEDYNDDDYEYQDYQEYQEAPSAYFERLAQMEEEQEQLNSSLLALTSHFAKVQLRLKQIVDASPEEKEALLKELEEFAFRGIPDIREPKIDPDIIPRRQRQDTESDQGATSETRQETCTDLEPKSPMSPRSRSDQLALADPGSAEMKLEQQRLKQQELMKKLKQQLEELESYAYETGDLDAIPSSMLLQRQTVIIEQLKGKLPLNLEDLDKLSAEELRLKVDKALRDLINPIIMKEQLVNQLKTQITDLERFIQFIQKRPDLSHGTKSHECTCACPMHGNSQTGLQSYNAQFAKEQVRKTRGRPVDPDDEAGDAIRMMRRALTLLQIFSWVHFGCANQDRAKGKRSFERNLLKKTTKGNHWGDLRARLELAIDKIIELQSEKSKGNDSDYNTSDSEDGPNNCYLLNERMTAVVRKEFAVALRDLLQHGLIGSDQRGDYDGMPGSMMTTAEAASSWFIFGCFSTRSANAPSNRPLTIWDVILKYYYYKNGDEYNQSTARKLSQTFNLQMVGGYAITAKQSLLSTIYDIIQSHTRLKRSPDSHFKAFICAALNQGKLVTWLKLILKTQSLIESCYEPWSYVASTNCEDALRSLDRLTHIKFNLAIDVAIRQLNNINDAF